VEKCEVSNYIGPRIVAQVPENVAARADCSTAVFLWQVNPRIFLNPFTIRLDFSRYFVKQTCFRGMDPKANQSQRQDEALRLLCAPASSHAEFELHLLRALLRLHDESTPAMSASELEARLRELILHNLSRAIRAIGRAAPAPVPLTRRQAEVLHLIIDCKTNPEIAIILGLRVDTVKKHVSALLAKFGVENRHALRREAAGF